MVQTLLRSDKGIASRKTFVGFALPIATGAALASTALLASPAKAIPILIDSFTTTTSPLTVLGTGSSPTPPIPPPVSIGGTDLAGATRGLQLSATTLSGSPLTSSLDINPGIVSLSAPNNHTATANLTYSGFGPTNIVGSGPANNRFEFDIDYDFATAVAPVTLTLTANGTSTQTIQFTGGGGSTVPIQFLFDDFTSPSVFNSLTSLVVTLTSGRANDISISSPIRAVPVPPAFIGTLLAAGLAAVKVRKKKPALAGKSEP
jgi:hypothetical protein